MDPPESPDNSDELEDTIDSNSLPPAQYEQLKDTVYDSDRLSAFRQPNSRYLVAGAGKSYPDRYERRVAVRDQLDSRPDTIATFLEDFDLGSDNVALWFRIFDILCGEATHIVAVLEAYEGGIVTELGCIAQFSYRDKAWVLKRHYDTKETRPDQYQNSMAGSVVAELNELNQQMTWRDEEELLDKTRKIQ
jgi:hypothetical protein